MKTKYTTLLGCLLVLGSCRQEEKKDQATAEQNQPGQSTIYSADSGYTTGTTLNNKKNGWWKSFNAHGQPVSEELYDEQEQVMRERLITDGEVSSERMVSKNGELVVGYHPNGKIQFYGFYKTDSVGTNKSLVGDSRQFDKNGTLRLYSNYDETEGSITEIEYDAKGQLREERHFHLQCPTCERVPSGVWKKYVDGKLLSTEKH